MHTEVCICVWTDTGTLLESIQITTEGMLIELFLESLIDQMYTILSKAKVEYVITNQTYVAVHT